MASRLTVTMPSVPLLIAIGARHATGVPPGPRGGTVPPAPPGALPPIPAVPLLLPPPDEQAATIAIAAEKKKRGIDRLTGDILAAIETNRDHVDASPRHRSGIQRAPCGSRRSGAIRSSRWAANS